VLSTAVRGRFTTADAEIAAGADDKVAAAVVEQAVNERGRQAVVLRDQGKHEEARQLLMQNATEIGAYAAGSKAPSPDLLDLAKQYNALAAQPAPRSSEETGAQRKALRALQAPSAGSGTRY
jgi:Ca-activated chloride channel family protein